MTSDNDAAVYIAEARVISGATRARHARLDPGINCSHCSGMPHWVYILANFKHGALYIGATSDLVRRVFEHREHVVHGFTRRYAVSRLVHFKQYDEPRAAI